MYLYMRRQYLNIYMLCCVHLSIDSCLHDSKHRNTNSRTYSGHLSCRFFLPSRTVRRMGSEAVGRSGRPPNDHRSRCDLPLDPILLTMVYSFSSLWVKSFSRNLNYPFGYNSMFVENILFCVKLIIRISLSFFPFTIAVVQYACIDSIKY